MIDAYIGLGSNLDDPEQQILDAMDELDCIPESWLAMTSSLYVSAPMGPQNQPDYVNAVALIRTVLEPIHLLDELQAIENRHGRLREQRWGPRTLDLDLLLYGDQVIDVPRLTVPHPGLAERAFVLYPLAEISPDLHVPGLGVVTALRDVSDGEQVRSIG